MMLDIFFEKFEIFIGAPNAVLKMRQLILHLAFCGAFSGEERIQPLNDSNVTQGSPAMPLIPNSWTWQRGKEIFQVIRGVSYKKEEARNSPAEGYLPILRANNIDGAINFEDLIYIPRTNIRAEQLIRSGDIVIAMSSGSKKLVGKAAKAFNNFNGSFGAFCGVVRNTSATLDDYLARYFMSPQYTSWVTSAGRGIGINNLSKTDLDLLPVPTPPLTEQKRIVAKVDEFMGLCDQLEAQQRERDTRSTQLARAAVTRFASAPTPTNLNLLFHNSFTVSPTDIRKIIVNLAVQGKLVPQDPCDEPVQDLINRIMEIRSSHNSKDFGQVQLDEIPYDIPESWIWMRMGNLAISSDSGWSPQCEPTPRSGNNWGVLKVSAVSWGAFQPEENKALPSGMNGRAEFEVRSGDFLLSRANTEELVARSVVVEETPPKLMMSDKIVRFTFPDEIKKGFINLANSSDFSRAYYARNASGTSSSMKNVGRAVMNNLPIPLPPLAEQERIVTKVAQMTTLVSQLEAQLRECRSTAETLTEAIVAHLIAKE